MPSRDVVLTRQREADFADRTLGQSSPQRAAQHNAGGAVLLKDWFKIGDVDWWGKRRDRAAIETCDVCR